MASPRLTVTREQHRAIFGTGDLLRRHGLDEYADRVRDGLREAAAGQSAVVVVGEVKRGKSSLVNALTGSDVSPVGVAEVTAAFLRVVPPAADLPDGAWALTDRGTRSRTSREQAWAVLCAATDEPSAHVEVAATGRWLPGVTLVDTPGFGGLESAHTRLARWMAARAGGLLMVIDAGQVLTAPELRFLTEAAEGVETVVLAVTKADRYPDGGRQVMAENRALLRRHAPRFAEAPMLAVSSTLAREAATSDDAEIRTLLEHESNIAALAGALHQRIADGRAAGLANVLRTAATGLDRLAVHLDGQRRALTGTDGDGDPVRAEREALAGLRTRDRRWRLDLERDLGRLRQSTAGEIGRLLDEARDRWRLRISREWQGTTESGATQLLAELDSELRLIAAHAGGRLRDDLVTLAADLFGSADAAVEVLRPATTELDALEPASRARRRPDMAGGGLDPALAGSALMGAGLADRMGLAGSMMGPFGLVFGGAWFLINLGARRLRLGRQRLDAALTEAVATLRADLIGAVDAAIRECRPELVIGVQEHLTAEAERLEAVIAAAGRTTRTAADQRAERAAAVDRELAAVTAQRDLVERQITILTKPGTSTATGASDPQRPTT
ncbi:dynamin [Actinoplanes italicus]|uniref:Dynamin family protein n=1 Tax=Actinoplanes italicus TaxID=113567 RepID=A0A2T0KGF5_9ACTN|nr:dynamin family protein [Actinoplanes italicus]PRX22512.1 dynamin family protein [Actinoplanes italicus]GIE36926.1 dynamin [Actinoplanes italicus]